MAVKVSVLGAAGGIGQSLSLLLKTQLGNLLKDSPSNSIELSLYDVAADALRGVATDLSHINTPVLLKHYAPTSREDESTIQECLQGSQIVVIPAGVPRKPGMTRDDLISVNARIIGTLGHAIAKACDLDKVLVLVISNPVNSLVPVIVRKLISSGAEFGKNTTGVERRVFGVTQLDMVRASAFIQQYTDYRGNEVPAIPVIGGHSGETIVPVLSKAQKEYGFSDETRKKIVHRVQYGGDEVVQAKNGTGSATLSMAYAAYKIMSSFVELLLGQRDEVRDTLFVSLADRNNDPVAKGAEELLKAIDGVTYFAIPVVVTAKDGVVEVDGSIVNSLDEYEKNTLLPVCLEGLRKNIETSQALSV